MHARSAIPVAAALAMLGSAPVATATWTAPEQFAGPGAASVFAAGNRHGSEVLVWKIDSKRGVGTGNQRGLAGSIRARIRLPNGKLGRPATISGSSAIVSGPQVGVDENGNATAVWTEAGRHERIMASFHPHGKPFGKPVEIGRAGAFLGARPAIAVGRFGDTAIAWNEGRHLAVRRYGANAQCAPARHFACYRPAVLLRPGGGHVVAIGPLGSAYVAWPAVVHSGEVTSTRLRMVVVRRSGLRSREHFVSRAADGNVSEPSIAVRSDGTADLAWRSSLPAGGEQDERAPVLVAASTPDAVVTQPQAVSTLRGDEPSIRVTRQGEAIVSWGQTNSTPQNPDGQEVAYAVRAAGAATFGPATRLSGPGEMATGQSLAADAEGDAMIVYLGAPAIGPPPAGTGLAKTSLRPAGGVFGPGVAFPSSLTGGLRVFGAGSKLTAFGATGGGVVISDWTPSVER